MRPSVCNAGAREQAKRLLVKKDITSRRPLWLWRSLSGGLALAFGLVKGLGIRCLENQGGWPEWLLVPGLVLAGLAVVLVRSDAWEGARLR